MSTEIWLYILISIIFIVALVIILSWNVVLKTEPTFPPAPGYTTTGLGMRCTPSDEPVDQTFNSPTDYIPPHCDIGLICHAGFCYKDIGSSCNTIFECVPGTLVCNGFCSATGRTGLDGKCSTNSDCDTAFVCDTSLIPAVCKRPIGGTPCFSSNDCVSGSVCSANVCIPVSQDGESCLPVTDADSCEVPDVCKNYANGFYFCQPPDVATAGDIGSTCYYWNDSNISQPSPPIKNVTIDEVITTVPSCATGFQCNNIGNLDNIEIFPTYGQCGSAPTVIDNASAGWFDQCTISNGCQSTQVCLNSQCSFPVTKVSNLITYEPLSCQNGNSNGLCLTNYSCKGNYPTGDSKCIGVNNNIPAINLNSCLNGISSNYNVVMQTFQDINSDPTNRSTTASWSSAGLIVPASINSGNINQVNFSTFENNTFNILAIFHIIGQNSYIISSNSGNVTITISPVIVAGGRVAKVGYTTTGNYYCVIEYAGFANIYFSTLNNFSDCIPYFTSYNVRYYIGGNNNFNSTYIYSVSVDDRILDPSLGAANVRVFMITGNNGPYSTSQYLQQGRLCSINLNGPSLNAISNALNAFSFNLLSYNPNYTAIDSSLVWCEAFLSRTLDISQASQSCLGYQFNTTRAIIYGANPTNPNTNVGFTPVFPINNISNRALNQITAFNSRSTDLFNNPCYYVANQGANSTYASQIYLGLTWISQDVVLPGEVDLTTLISMPFPSPINDSPGYRPKICLLTKTCI